MKVRDIQDLFRSQDAGWVDWATTVDRVIAGDPNAEVRGIALQIAARCHPLGQSAVQLIGRGEKPVSRLALGTGAITYLTQMLDLYDLDMAICSDDGYVYWHDGALCIDSDLPVVVVNHMVSEIHGMEVLADWLRERVDMPVHFIPQRCMYRLVGTGPTNESVAR